MFEKHVSHSICLIPSLNRKFFTVSRMWHAIVVPYHEVIYNWCYVRDYNRSDDLVPLSATNQSSILNYVEIDAPINGDASIDTPLLYHQIQNFSARAQDCF